MPLWTRKTSNIIRDDGSYQPSHVWHSLLTDVRNRKSVLMKTSVSRNVDNVCLISCVIELFTYFRYQPDETFYRMMQFVTYFWNDHRNYKVHCVFQKKHPHEFLI